MSSLKINLKSKSADSKNDFVPRRGVLSDDNKSVNSNPTNQKEKVKGKGPKIFKILLILLILGAIGGAVWYFFFSKSSGSSESPFSFKSITKDVTKVVIPDLKQDKNGYTNVLLVGKDTREFSKGLQNTDTVIVASYNDKTGEVLLVSIPRDTFIEYPGQKGRYGRVNGVYANSLKNGEAAAMDKLKIVAKDVTGLEIHYWAVVDLAGFKKAIDVVGGVDVDVERAFTDYRFPDNDQGKYRTLSFKKGLQHMDGATALDYARSRKASGPEGSDFSRAKRQQKVIAAFLDKLIKIESLNLDKAIKLKESFDQSVTYSEFDLNDMRAGLARINKVSSKKVTSVVLDPSLQGGTLMVHPPLSESGGAYAIWPVLGLNKWSAVQSFIQRVIADPAIYREGAVIYVYDSGLGGTTSTAESAKIKKKFNLIKVVYGGSNVVADQTNVVIYVTNEKPETLTRLKKYLEEDLGYSVEIVRGVSAFKAKHSEDLSVVFGPAPVEEPSEGSAEGAAEEAE